MSTRPKENLIMFNKIIREIFNSKTVFDQIKSLELNLENDFDSLYYASSTMRHLEDMGGEIKKETEDRLIKLIKNCPKKDLEKVILHVMASYLLSD
jgi:hypothetical protein